MTEPNTGVQYPLATRFWDSESMRCLGAGHKVKKIAILAVKVYAVGVYAESEKAGRELGIRSRGGVFEGESGDAAFCDAYLDGAFGKCLLLELVRDVDGATFSEAIETALEDRMRALGESGKLEEFKAFFLGKKLTKGTNVAMRWRPEGALEVALSPGQAAWADAAPGLRIDSAGMCRALFGVFVGEETRVPEARAACAAGVRDLIQADALRD